MPHSNRVKTGLFILIGLIGFVAPVPGWTQQNLFNVPSSEITEKNKLFFQQQFNFSMVAGNGNTTLDYGLGNDLEIGVNLFNLDLYPTNGYLQNPHLLFNFQKGLKITENYKMSFGTQTGLALPLYHTTIAVPSFSYVNNAINLNEWGKYYLGVYYANHAYAGAGNLVGIMAGFEFPLVRNMNVMGDILTGSNNISVAVLGMVFYLSNDWQISLGAQLPAPGSHNDYGVVLELTKLKW